MDQTEQLVEKYLKGLGIGSVVFEPDGNVPPDFSINGDVGIEVRRLNQNHEFADGSVQGLEELSIPLWQRFKKFLPSLGPSRGGECWYVGIDFHRPLESWKEIRARVERELLAFMSCSVRSSSTISITEHLEIDLIRAGKDHGSFFVLGASSDGDSGGLVMSEVARNLRLCLAEKERKIRPYRERYKEWWLVLVDYIDYGMELEDREFFRSKVMPTIPHSFDKIVFIDPRDYLRAFEL